MWGCGKLAQDRFRIPRRWVGGGQNAIPTVIATVIASDAAAISFADGLVLRRVALALTWAAAVALGHAPCPAGQGRIRPVLGAGSAGRPRSADPAAPKDEGFTRLSKIVLILFAATLAAMNWGVSVDGWCLAQMSGPRRALPAPELCAPSPLWSEPRRALVRSCRCHAGRPDFGQGFTGHARPFWRIGRRRAGWPRPDCKGSFQHIAQRYNRLAQNAASFTPLDTMLRQRSLCRS